MSLGKASKAYQKRLEEYCLDIEQSWLLSYWCEALRVPPETLRHAMDVVGTNLNAVDAYLADCAPRARNPSTAKGRT
jgi:hypothetical protein